MNAEHRGKILAWLRFLAVVWAIPSFFLLLALNHQLKYSHNRAIDREFELLEKYFNHFNYRSSPHRFLERRLRSFFRKIQQEPPTPETLRREIARFSGRFPAGLFEMYVFNDQKRLVSEAHTGKIARRPGIVDEVQAFFAFISKPGILKYDFNKHFEELKAFLNGGAAVARDMRNKPGDCVLIKGNATGSNIAEWGFWDWNQGKSGRNIGLLVFIFPKVMSEEFILRETLKEYRREPVSLGFAFDNGVGRLPEKVPEQKMKMFLRMYGSSPETRLRDTDTLAFFKTMDHKTIMTVAPRPEFPWQRLGFVIFVFSLGSLFFLDLTWGIMVQGRIVRLPVGIKLLLFFSVALGIPLIFSAFLGDFYLTEKSEEILQDTRRAHIKNLHRIDSAFQESITRRFLYYKRMIARFQRQQLPASQIASTLTRLYNNYYFDNYFMVSSQSKPLLEEFYVQESGKRELAAISPNERRKLFLSWLKWGHYPDVKTHYLLEGKRPPLLPSEADRISVLTKALSHAGKVVMNNHNLNHGFPPIPENQNSKIDFESFMDKANLTLMKSLYLQSDGMFFLDRTGGNCYFAHVIAGPTGESNYFIFFDHWILTLERAFLKHLFTLPLVHSGGSRLKVIGYQYGFSPHYPDHSDSLPFRPLLERLRSGRENTLSLQMSLRGELVDVTCLNGVHLKDVALFMVTPLSVIQRQIQEYRQRVLWSIVGVGIFALILISLLFERLWLPLGDLTHGMVALQNKDFDHRLPVRSADELGKLCNVFNETIRHLQEMEVGSAVQSALLHPGKLLKGRVAFYGRNQMTQSVGGDFFDFIEISRDTVAVVIGDVSGHGLSAALVTAMAKAGFAILCPRYPDKPDEVLSRISKSLLSILDKKKMMSCFLLMVNTEKQSLAYANGGHCAPLFRQSDGRFEYLRMNSFPMGVRKNPKYQTVNIDQLPPDILLYTDGLIEAKFPDGKMFGYEGFQEVVQQIADFPAETVVDHVFAAVEKAVSGVPFDDDTTCVLIRLSPPKKTCS